MRDASLGAVAIGGHEFPAADCRSAVQKSDVAVLAVPWPAVPNAIASCGDVAGRIIIDVTNPLGFGPDGLELVTGYSTSGGEIVAGLASGASVFKTFNQVGFKVLADATEFAAPPAMFVAGDDDAKKPIVMGLVRDAGFAAFDAGPLRRSRILEPLAMVWMNQVINHSASELSAFGFMTKT